MCLEARNVGIWLYWSLVSFLSYISVLTVDVFNIIEINSLEGHRKYIPIPISLVIL